MIKKLLTDYGRQSIAADFEIGAISGSHDDGTDREINLGIISERATMIADQASDEEAYRRGRNSSLAVLGTAAIFLTVTGAYVWAEKTGRVDFFPDDTRVDFGMEQGPSIPAGVPTQAAPTDMPPIVRFS